MTLLAPERTREQEVRRIAAVRRYGILDTPAERPFDRITALAASLFRVPFSTLSIVDEDRIWFKSCRGLNVRQVDREPGLCASSIWHDMPWILTDARKEVSAFANNLIVGEFGIRFYVGIPLRTTDGLALETLNVLDRIPREVHGDELKHLDNLASLAMDLLELRHSARCTCAAPARLRAEN